LVEVSLALRVDFCFSPAVACPTKTGEREKIAVRREHDQLKALRALLERDGLPIAEQIRCGVDLWLIAS
jgi:hypothetical protein